MYRVPSDESVIACTITKDSVEEEKEPMIEKISHKQGLIFDE